MKIDKTDRFEADIRRLIIVDLAAKNPYAAQRYLLDTDRVLADTANYPLSKQELPHLGAGIRSIQLAPYVIFYRVRGDTLRALRFFACAPEHHPHPSHSRIQDSLPH